MAEKRYEIYHDKENLKPATVGRLEIRYDEKRI